MMDTLKELYKDAESIEHALWNLYTHSARDEEIDLGEMSQVSSRIDHLHTQLEKHLFVEAVKQNEYAALELDDGVSLVTDWENPMFIVNNAERALEEVEELLHDKMGDVFVAEGFDMVEEIHSVDFRVERWLL